MFTDNAGLKRLQNNFRILLPTQPAPAWKLVALVAGKFKLTKALFAI